MTWATAVLLQGNVMVKMEGETTLMNEMRNGVLPCQIMNVLSPGIARISDVKSTFSALENLASFTAAMINYGVERKAVFRPLDFVNGTQKGDETMIRNLTQLALLAQEKGFKVSSFDSGLAKELLDGTTAPPASATSAEHLGSNSSVDATSEPTARILQRIEVLDAGMSRILRSLQDRADKQEKASRTAQGVLDRLTDSVELVLRKMTDIEVAQRELAERVASGMVSGSGRRPRPLSVAESEAAEDSEDEGALKAGVKPRLIINSDVGPLRRGTSTESLPVNGGEESLRRAATTSDKLRAGDYNMLANSSPSLLGSAPPPTPISPKHFAKIPIEVIQANLPKAEMMRLSVVYEFIETEADYVKDLGIMVNYHKPEVKLTKLISDADITTLFSNIEQLISVNNEANPIIEDIGDAIVEIADSFKVYTTYCGNYPTAMKLVHQLQTRPDFKEHVQRWMNSPEGRGLSLESFLIKPVQRICKYPLLMRELLKYTDKAHKDYSTLMLATEKIEAVVTLVNEATQALDRKERLITIASRLEASSPLNLQEKRLLKDGLIQKISAGKSRERFVILCAEVMIVCKVPSKAKYQLESVVSTADVYLKTDFRGDLSTRGLKHFFQVQIAGDRRETFTISCISEDDKTKWTEAFNQAAKLCDQEGRRERPASGDGATLKRISDSFEAGSLKNGRRSVKKTVGGISANMFAAKQQKMFESQSTLETEENFNGKKKKTNTSLPLPSNAATRESTWKLPADYIVLDPATGKPYQEEGGAFEEEVEDDFEPDIVDGYPDWRYVDRGDGNPYYFNSATNEVSWFPPGNDDIVTPNTAGSV
ncbi:Myosin 10A, isoform D [Irineochytrium annulatum]|nr:Myosin 10A, isoform D [Irineochytrium annulatum]